MAVSSFSLRRAQPDDAAALSQLKLAAFRETFLDGFAIPYPPADLALFERDTYGLASVRAELADPSHATWVAQADDGRLIAYAHVGPCKLPHPDASPEQGELYQLYALNMAQGMGVGRALMDAAFAWLDDSMPGPLWLGVWSGNHRAQAVYAGRGFVKVGDYGFRVGDWTDAEYILRRG
ncbi:GNAT family N-acetyltransferase [Sphingobium sp. HBC34]|uniref:GNAT family N-acetyltransferase n=1 Tax=Sphingobium cyanobacteriorum TaxID=3063954 RepID=A0ABT8ZH45_9SPHN|nr:GNAT family N-acetyltransferase [Sphingobium sp. HBC34]MDO7833862.1 GNAT family N-acetyltransferase [Sphingobium sp. HBC34]